MWKKYWHNFIKLIKTPEFKFIVVLERESLQKQIQQDELIMYTTKLELGVLACLWCTGTHQEKIEFLMALAFPENNSLVTAQDDELLFVFVKLLEFSNDLPLRYCKVFEDVPSTGYQEAEYSVLHSNDVNDDASSLFTIQDIIEEEMQPIEDLHETYSEHFEDWLLEKVFPPYEGKM